MRAASKTGLRKSTGGSEKANTEVEVKLRIADRPRLLAQLRAAKAKATRARVHERNTLYDTAEGSLARHGQMLRIRVENLAMDRDEFGRARKIAKDKPEIGAWLTFKGPAKKAKANGRERYKVREEHELSISDPEEIEKILEALGLRAWFRYEKFRSTFELPGMSGLQLTLDETPIGVFVELEGERREIDWAARLLGFSASEYINKSYGALFMEECGRARPASHNEPDPSCGLPDMLFRS